MELRGLGRGMAFLGGAMIMLECVAAWCSSPQTLEINADARADTMMKYVGLGLLSGALLCGVAGWFEPQHARQIAAGGAIGAATIGAGYLHARKSGLSSPGPATEHYGNAWS